MTTFRRRDFIKVSVSTGIGGTFFTSVVGEASPAPFQKDTPQKNKRVIVAGGGIGGLCCGYELLRRGIDVVVLEALRDTGDTFLLRGTAYRMGYTRIPASDLIFPWGSFQSSGLTS